VKRERKDLRGPKDLLDLLDLLDLSEQRASLIRWY